MADPITQPVPDMPHPGPGVVGPTPPEVGHEQSDVDIKPILWFAASLLGLAVVVHVGLAWLLHTWKAQDERAKQSQFPLAAEEAGKTPPGPLVEGFDYKSGASKSAPGVSKPGESSAVAESFDRFLKEPPKARKGKTWQDVGQTQPSDANSGRFSRGGGR